MYYIVDRVRDRSVYARSYSCLLSNEARITTAKSAGDCLNKNQMMLMYMYTRTSHIKSLANRHG